MKISTRFSNLRTLSIAIVFSLFSGLSIFAQTNAPSIQTGVSFLWDDIQTVANQPATLNGVILNGVTYTVLNSPSAYTLTQLGPGGDANNNIRLNGGFTETTSASGTWGASALAAFQDGNLNHYFEATGNGEDICDNYTAADGTPNEATTTAQRQSLDYFPGILVDATGVIAITERNSNNCLHIELYGTPAGGGPVQNLGETFINQDGTQWGFGGTGANSSDIGTPGAVNPPSSGSDYWLADRVIDNNGTIGVALFNLQDIAPLGSTITSIQFTAATNDHGDGKVFLLSVGPGIIDATDDSGNAIAGAGGTPIPNVLSNDEFNGSTPTIGDITLTQISTSDPGVTLNPLTGAVTVDSSVTEGLYVIEYEICESAEPTNCTTAFARIYVRGACPTLNSDGVFNANSDVLITSYHQTIARTTTGLVTWGEDMDSNGATDANVTIVENPDYDYTGDIIHYAISGNSGGQGFMATTDNLYAWGLSGEVVDASFVTGNGFDEMSNAQALPFSASDIFNLHASSDVLFVLLNTGEIWVATTGATAPNGNASTNANIWQQVQTSLGVPLTGASSITGNKYAGYALMGNGDIYTWGTNVVLGNGTGIQDLDYATLMTAPPVPVTYIGSFTNDASDTGLLALGTDTKVYGVGDNTAGEVITTGTGVVTTWTAIQDASGTSDLTGVLQLATSHTSEQHAGAAVIVEGATPTSTRLLYSWGRNSFYSLGHGANSGTSVIQNPTIPPSFTVDTDDPVSVSVGGHALTMFNRANGGSICFVGHISNNSTGGLTTGDGSAFECILPSGVDLCGSITSPTIVAVDDDFSGSPIDSNSGGTTASVFDDNGNGTDLADGVAATNANIDDSTIAISNNGGLVGVTINTDGTINVPSGAVSGTYTVQYTICLDIDNLVCDVANATIVVENPCTDGATVGTATANDPDADGINNVCDVDDDNDGILDTAESSGGNDPLGDADGDGILNFEDDFDDGGLGDGSTTDYTDTNGDGIPDVYDNDDDGIPSHLDTDSDNDGCNDVIESGGNDPDGDGVIGEAPYTYDTNGQVTGTNATGGYDGVTGNETLAIAITAYTAPTDQTEAAGNTGTFSVIGAAARSTVAYTGTPPNTVPNYGPGNNVNSGINFQWYIGDPDAGGTIIDGTDTNYTNFTTSTLSISDVTGLDGTDYCVVMTHDNNACIRIVECAELTVFGCSISAIASSNESVCSDNGTPADITDDTFTADITVTFVDAPATGTLDLTGDGTASVNAAGLTSPYTFTGVTLPANGSAISLTATFSDDTGCTLENTSVVTAPLECSDDSCPDIIPPGNPTAAVASGDITLSVSSGASITDPATLNSVTIVGQPNPFTGIFRPNQVAYQFANPGAASQFVVDQTVIQATVADGPAIFDPALIAANSENDLRHYLSLDNTMTTTDFVDFKYNSSINSASNRYVVVTERDGNNEVSVQALDNTGTPIGSIVTVSPGDYFDTLVETDFLQNVHMAIYPLTAFVPSGTAVQGIRVTQTGASGGDAGDGKVFMMYDTAFYTPPPTIEPSTAAIQPTCPTDLGSITIDATDNGGGALEYSVNGAAGPWQASNIFNGLIPGTYTPAVRYQGTPLCLEVSTTTLELISASCPNPSIELVKSVASVASVGAAGILDDEITYSFTVTNTGNVTLTDIVVTDPLLGTVTCLATTLTPGNSTTCTAGVYAITQTDIDNGGVENSATVASEGPGGDTGNPADDVVDTSDTGTTGDGTTITDPETVETDDIDTVNGDNNDGDPTNDVTPFEIVAPSIELVKSVASVASVGAAGILDDEITYSFTVTNTGNVTLTDIVVTDPLLGTVTCLATTLTPGNSTTCTAGVYAITQTDIDNGGVENSATVASEGPGGDTGNPADDVVDTSDTGTTGDGTTVTDPETVETDDIDTVNGDNNDSDPTNDVTPFEIVAPSIELVKSVASVASVGAAGILDDEITYSFTVTNTGNVTLTDIVVTDPLLGTVTCLATTLTPGNSTTCTAGVYAITQTDIDNGGVENSATVASEGPGGDTGNPADDVVDTSDTGTTGDGTTITDPETVETDDIDTVNGDNNDSDPTNDVTPFEIVAPSIELVKSVASVASVGAAGILDDEITYSFTVTNTGNVTLTDIVVTDPLLGTVTCLATTLTPGNSTTCTAGVYAITQTDIDNGGVENSATVASEGPGGDTGNPADDVVDTSDTGTTGDGTTITDPETVETDDIDTVNGDNNDGDPTNDVTPFEIVAPSIELVKSVASVASVGAAGILDDEITYSFTVTNTGNVTLTDIVVTDPLLGTVTCLATTLTPGNSTTCTAGVYAITQTDIDNGGVENSATVASEGPGGDTGNPADDVVDTSDTGTTGDGTTVTDPETVETDDIDTVNGDNNDSDPTNDVTPFEIVAPSIELVKSVASVASVGAAGILDDEITYSFTVTNTGNVTLTDIVVTDPLLGTVTCLATTLTPGNSTTCTAGVYAITQTDIDNGGVENSATVASEGPGGDTGNPADDVVDTSDTGTTGDGTTITDPETVETDDIDTVNGDNNDSDPTNDVTPFEIVAPSIELVKSVASVASVGAAGILDDEITYSFTVTNTGNVTLTDIVVTDPLLGTVTCLATTLTPGNSTTCTAGVYTITQTDIDNGGVENSATVASEGPGGDTGNPADDVVDTSDTGTTGDGTTVTDPETVETDDIDTVNGDNNDGDPTNDVTPFEIVAPSIELVKSVASVASVGAAGILDDEITYSFTVTNTGNVTLTDIVVTDPLLGTVTCLATTLTPGNSTTCTAGVYAITQTDIDNGGVENSATVASEGPGGDTGNPADDVVDTSDTGTTGDGTTVTDPETVETDDIDTVNGDNNDSDPTNDVTPFEIVAPSIELVKSVASVASVGAAGILDDEITYSFTVTNTGNVTLTDIVVTDPLLGTVTCLATTLTPGNSTTCTAGVYAITQTDIDNGGVENSATVASEGPGGDTGNPADDIVDTSDTGTTGDGTTVTDPETVETDDIDTVNGDNNDGDPTNDVTPFEIAPNASIELVKSVASVASVGAAGILDDEITYSFTVTNTGNVTLTDIVVTDPLLGTVTCLATTLTPGNSTTCTAGVYAITQTDIDNGGVENSATVASEGPGGDTGNPADDVVDTSDTGTTGDGTTVTDPETVETDDIDTVNGDNNDSDPTNDVTPFEIAPNASIELVKSVASVASVGAAGILDDEITYSFTVTNTGNVTLTDIVVTDPLLGTVTCLATTLTPGNSTTCTAGVYAITQTDIDNGGVENSATVASEGPGGDTGDTSDDVEDTSDTGTTGDGTTVTDPETVETDDIDTVNGDNNDGDPTNDVTPFEIAPNASIELVKSVASVASVGAAGILDDEITYSFTVTNTGNVTLTDIVVTDPLLGTVTCLATTLTPGNSTTCTAGVYAITQTDIDNGGVENSATVASEGPGGDTGDTSDDVEDTSDTGTTGDGTTVTDPETVETDDIDTVNGDNNDGDPTNDVTPFEIAPNPSIEAVKTVAITDDVLPAGASLGDTMTYTITVTNTGNVTLDNVSIADTFTDADGNPLVLATGPTFVGPSTLGSGEGDLLVGEVATYTATYVIEQDAVDAGGFQNSVVASGDSPDDTTVNDTSDDDDNTDGNTEDDPTETIILEDPSIEAVKTVAITDDVLPAGASLGDTMTYTITVTNTGNVTLDNVSLADTFTDADGNPLVLATGPTFVGPSTLGSGEGDLQVGEVATYTATYVIEQDAIDAGGFQNSIVASGDSPDDTTVNDTSDDGDDNDGNTDDDPTETTIVPDPSISLIKTTLPLVDTNGDGVAGSIDDIISYVFVVENTGNVTLTDIQVQDVLPGLNLMGGPIAVLIPGQIDNTTFTATYQITQDDLDTGFVINSATVSSEGPDGDTGDPTDDVTDTSDDPNDTTDNDDNGDGDPDDPTVTEVNSIFDLDVDKIVDELTPVVGDEVTFTIEVANIGNVTATDIVISEQIPSGYIFVSAITTAGTYSEFDGEWTIAQLNPDQVEILQITVEVLGFGDYVNTAFVDSAVGGVDVNPSNDEDDAAVDPICLTVYNEFSPNGDGINETFVIDCLERYPNNKLEIYNRWGNIVYSKKGYLNDWDGTSNGRAVINQSDKLPVGTYYYVLDLGDGSKPRVDWLYLNR